MSEIRKTLNKLIKKAYVSLHTTIKEVKECEVCQENISKAEAEINKIVDEKESNFKELHKNAWDHVKLLAEKDKRIEELDKKIEGMLKLNFDMLTEKWGVIRKLKDKLWKLEAKNDKLREIIIAEAECPVFCSINKDKCLTSNNEDVKQCTTRRFRLYLKDI